MSDARAKAFAARPLYVMNLHSYGGTQPYTGPTLAGCTLQNDVLEIQFDTKLLGSDTLVLKPAFPKVQVYVLQFVLAQSLLLEQSSV